MNVLMGNITIITSAPAQLSTRETETHFEKNSLKFIYSAYYYFSLTDNEVPYASRHPLPPTL